MAAKISATGICSDLEVQSSVVRAAKAAGRALADAGVALEDVGLMINVGLYRDENMCEPSMASLIQKELGLNLDILDDPEQHTTFSVDLVNGPCGLANAMQVADAFIATRDVEHVLIVAGDGHPSMQEVADFPYLAMGGAMIISRADDDGRGFAHFYTQAEAEGSFGVESFHDPRYGAGGHQLVTVRHEAGLEARCVEFASQVARGAIAQAELDVEDLVLLPTRITPGFAGGLGRSLGVPALRTMGVGETSKDSCTAALISAYREAQAAHIDLAGKTLLFVAVAAGLSSTCVVYHS